MLHLTEIEAPSIEETDLFGLHRGYLFGWREDLAADGRAFGEALVGEGLSAPPPIGAIAAVAHMPFLAADRTRLH